jgi:divalent metal cation (Fe/Co/Zn/Cd) transporter
LGDGRAAFGHADRPGLLRQAVRLAWIAVAWSVLEGGFGVWAAWQAGSVALMGFGLDSVLEAASAGVIVWRMRAERGARSHADVERLETRAGRLIAIGLGALTLYVVAQAIFVLVRGDRPLVSRSGIVLTILTMAMMQWLARRKRQVARGLGSAALRADAFQATACFYLSFIALLGISCNALFGWWWADPAAALVMVVPLVSEARKAWAGDHDD